MVFIWCSIKCIRPHKALWLENIINLYRKIHIKFGGTEVPVFSGLCDQGTPAVSGQYNDVRGDFQYKLTRDQGTPANADADRHLFVIFAPQPGDSALFILFFITLGRKR